jgi:hypothetical protein
VEEHEDGRILPSLEIWTRLENGAMPQRFRERSEGGEKQRCFISVERLATPFIVL